ncbi:MAG: ABC transporter permease [Micromonosporaceae bacterium]|jgi:ribose/xylose/arabinose/galactoside ABC-type transport system permease subunit|nr:ABC transporter permease [Micromonosporaceae bacterium]
MAYDEPTFRWRDSERSDSVGLRDDRSRNDTGFRLEPDFRRSTSPRASSYPANEYGDPDLDDGRSATGRNVPLGDVFDDPEHGDPGRDRLTVHLVWETVLLVAAAALAVLLYRENSDVLRGAQLDKLLVQATALGLLALGAGVSLRAGAPNLALGPTAVIAAVFFAHEGDRGVVPSTAVVAGAAAAAGLVLALFVVGLHVPAWAASLGAALGGIVWIQQVDGPVRVTGQFDPTDHAFPLFAAFAVAAALGGALGAVKGVRRLIGRFRPVSDPAKYRGGVAAVLTTLAVMLSMVLAAVAGVLFSASSGPTVTASPGLELTGLALGAALLGGTSAYGRRGGVFGTLLAVVLLTLFIRYDDVRGWDISLFAVAAAMLAGGLVVTRLVEAYGRPQATDLDGGLDEDGWVTASPSGRSDLSAGSGWSSRQDSWSSALPAQPTNGRGDAWEEDRWGAPPR